MTKVAHISPPSWASKYKSMFIGVSISIGILATLFATIIVSWHWSLGSFNTPERAFKNNPVLLQMGEFESDGVRKEIKIDIGASSIKVALEKYDFGPLESLNENQNWHNYLSKERIVNEDEKVFYKIVNIRACTYYYLIIPKRTDASQVTRFEGTRFTFMCL